jgi:hypothetical protein
MKNQFKVINTRTKQEQFFNSEELKRFFYCEYDPKTNKIKYNNKKEDYSIYSMRSATENILLIINCLAIVGTIIYLLSQWI